MFKSWRKATAGSTAGRIGRGFHRVLSRVALPAVLIAALVATPLQILGDPGAVQAESAGVGVDLQNIPDRFAQTDDPDPITVRFAEMRYDVLEGEEATVVVEISEAPDANVVIPLTALQSDVTGQVTPLDETVTIQANQMSAEFRVTTTSDQIDDEDDFLLSLTFDTMSTDWPTGTDWPGGRLMVGNPSITNINIIDVDANNIDINVVRQSVFEGSDKIPNEDGTAAGADDATWEVKLTKEPTGPVIVTIASNRPGVATVSRATLTFDDNNYIQAQTVTVEGDEDFEFDDETVTFTHSAEGGGYDDAKARTVDVKVIDDDTPGLVFSPIAVRMLEGGNAVYCLRLNGPPTSRMQVNVILPNEYSDLVTLSTSRLVFEPHNWTRCFNVRITSLEDDEDTQDNGVVIEHTTDGRGGFEGVTGQFAISIEDDDKPGLNVSTFSETIAEDGEVTWQVQLNTEPTADVTVSLESLDPGAATVSPAQLTFTTRNWNRNQDVTVSGEADGDVGDERVSIKHTAASDDSNYAGKTRSILVIVRDAEKDDVGIKLSTPQLRVDEDGSNTFKVSLAGGAPKGTVTIAVTSTDAAKAAVELPSSAQNLEFDDTNWETEQTVTVNAPNETFPDADDTMDETGITIMMTATSSLGEDSPFHDLKTSVPVTVVDDDKAGIKVDPNAVTVYEGTNKAPNEDGTAAGADDATWTVSLNTTPAPDNDGSEVVVTVASTNPNAVLISTPDSGDPAASVDITFSASNFTDGVVVTATGVEDADFRSNDVNVTHKVTTGTYAADERTVTVTATDKDTPTIVLTQVQPATETDPYTLEIEEGADRHQYKVNLSNRPTGRVNIAIARPDANDLGVSTSRLVFHPHEWRADGGFNVYVTPSSNDGNEIDETYNITHTATGGGYDNAQSVLSVKVVDSDTSGIVLSRTALTLDERDGDEGREGSFSVRLKTPPDDTVTVTLGFEVGSDTDAVEITEPMVQTGQTTTTLTFTTVNWEDPQTVTVKTIPDDDINNQTATVTLGVASSDAEYNHVDVQNPINRTVAVNVTDGDRAGLVIWKLSEDADLDLNKALSVNEDAGSNEDVFRVKLAAQPADDVEVAVRIPQGQQAKATVVSADRTLDFTTNTWDTAQTVTLDVREDDTAMDDTVTVMMTSTIPQNRTTEAAFNGLKASVKVTIIDLDKAGIKVDPNAVTVHEGTNRVGADANAAAATWTVSLNNDPDPDNDGSEVVVKVESRTPGAVLISAPGSGDPAAALDITFTRTNFTDGVEVTATGVEDADFRSNDVVVTHSSAASGYENVSAEVTVTATDADTPTIVLGQVQQGDPYTLEIEEGADRYQYKVNLSNRPTGRVNIAIARPDANELGVSTSRLVFHPHEWRADGGFNVYVTPSSNDGNEVDETFLITHTATGGGYDNAQSVLAVMVVDSGTSGIVLSRTALTLDERDGDEGREGSFSVRLKTPPDDTVTVTLGFDANTDTDAVEITKPTNDPPMLTFTTGNWEDPQTVTVKTIPDDDINNQSATVTLGVASSDAEYNHVDVDNEINRTVAVNVTDGDRAGLVIWKLSEDADLDLTKALSVNEDAGFNEDVFRVKLAAQPAADVEVAVRIPQGQQAKATVVSGDRTLDFTTNNWNTAQTVTLEVTADDTAMDDTVTVMMTSTIQGTTEAAFNDLKAKVTVNIIDLDKAGIKVDPNAVTVHEGTNRVGADANAAAATWTVSLNNDPDPDNDGSEVVVKVESRTPGAVLISAPGSGDPAAALDITFTRTNFTDGVEVTATGVEDADFRSNDVVVTHSSAASGYENVSAEVTVTATDADTPTIVLGQVQQGDPYTLEIEEGADRYQYKVNLSNRPTGRVNIAIARPDANELGVSTSRLVFHPHEWRADGGFNVYVTPSSNDGNEVDETFLITHTATGGGYDNAQSVLAVMVVDSGTSGIVLSRTALTLDERDGDEGREGSFSVRLKTPPDDTVTVTLGFDANTDTDAVEITKPTNDPPMLTFTTGNWEDPQTVTVKTIPDDDINNQSATVTLGVASSDAEYNHVDVDNEINRTVAVNVTDGDRAGLVIWKLSEDADLDLTKALSVNEDAGFNEDIFRVKLAAQPAADVEVAVRIPQGQQAKATVVSGDRTLDFTTNNWNTAQTVTLEVTADDTAMDDTVTVMMTSTIQGTTEAAFNDLKAKVTVNIIDLDKAGIKVDPNAVTVHEGTNRVGADANAAAATWTVSLNNDPDPDNDGSEVVVKVESRTPGAVLISAPGSGDPAAALDITFTRTNFTDGVEVTATGVEDADFRSNDVVVTHSSAASGYENVSAEVTVTATDADTPTIVLGQVQQGDPYTLEIEEGADRYQYKVNLSNRPTGRVNIAIARPDANELGVSTSRLVFHPHEWRADGGFNVYVTPSSNDGNEVDETFLITHTATGGGYDNAQSVLAVMVVDSGTSGIVLSRTALTLDERDGDEGREGSFSVRLKTPPDDTVTVTLGFDANTDTDAVEITKPTNDPPMLTFTTGNWEDPQTVTVKTIPDDDINNQSATVTLGVASSDAEYNHVDVDNEINRTVAVNVTDGDRAGLVIWKLSEDADLDLTKALSVNEDAGFNEDVFRVKLAAQPAADVEVAVRIPQGQQAKATVVSGDRTLDFTTNNWNTAQTVTLEVTADDTAMDDTVTVMMTSTIQGTTEAAFNDLKAKVTVNIIDLDKAGIKVDPNAVTVHEGATGTWNVSLNNDPGSGNTVKVTIAPNVAGVATVNPTEIDFTTSNYQDGVDVTVSGVQDNDFQTEDVTFIHSSEASGYANIRAEVRVSVPDADTATIILGQVQPATATDPYMLSIEEGADRHQYKVNLSHRPTGRVDIAIARPDANELEVSTSRLVFHPHEWRADGGFNVYVTPSSNDGNEVNDTYRIIHTATGGGYDNAESVLVVMVEDSGTPGVKVSKSNVTMTEGQTVMWDVTLNSAPTGPVTVNVGAKAGVGEVAEVSVTGSPLSFDADNYKQVQTITVMAVEDANLVGTTVEIEHIASGANYDNVSRTVPVTVNDNDTASLVLEGLTNGELRVDETNTNVTATFMVKLSAEPASDVTVTVVKESGGSDDVTVTGGDSLNFSTSTGSGGWDTAQEVRIQVEPDMTNEDEGATIKLTAAGAEFANVEATVPVKVIDDEVPGIRVSETELTIDEGADGSFTVALNTQPTADVTVTVSDPDKVTVSLQGNAQSLTFTTQTWDDVQRVTVAADEDNENVGDESVEIRVSSSSTMSDYNNLSSTVKVTVTDDDTGTLVFDPVVDPGVTVTENSSATYTVKLSHQPGADVTVTVTSDDTAQATVSPASLTFNTGNWNSAKTVTVYGTEDMDATNGSANIEHTAEGGGYEITTAVDMRVTVTDDDQPEILLSTDNLTVHEGGTASYNVKLKTMPDGGNVTVSITVPNDLTGKISLSSSSLTFTTENYGNQTVTVTGTEDDTDAADHMGALTHSASGGGYNNVTQKTVEVTVNDNDTLSYSFGEGSYTGTEGTTTDVALNLNIAAPDEKVFTIQVLHNTGASTDDYSMEIGGQAITLDGDGRFTVTFATGDSTKTIEVEVDAEDPQVVEAGESITFIVTGSSGVTHGSPNTTTISFEEPASN